MVLLIVVFFLTACAAQTESPSIEMLFSPTPTLTLTPTIQWFPVTSTPEYITPPTGTPNPAASPNYGTLIFSDEEDMTENWQGTQDTIGIVSVNEGSITLSVNSSRGTLTALRKFTSLSDFYFESVMTVNLCKKEDQVGVIFRAAGSQSYFRLLFKYDGRYSLQEVTGGQPIVLVDWSVSNQLQPGLNAPVKVGIWAYGKTIRIYLNGQLLDEVENNTFYNGGIGFYARAAGDTNVTVNFSGINVYEAIK